jgi:hypothetical protein
MSDFGREFTERIFRETCMSQRPPRAHCMREPGIHYTDLPEAQRDEPFCNEWNTYRENVGGLLAEGREGLYVLIKANNIIGVYDTWETAQQQGLMLSLSEPFFVHEIRAEEPHLRLRGLNLPWRS